VKGKVWDLVPAGAVLVTQYSCNFGGEINVSILIERNCEIEEMSTYFAFGLCFLTPQSSIYLEFYFF
jgi:hypothetical protein